MSPKGTPGAAAESPPAPLAVPDAAPTSPDSITGLASPVGTGRVRAFDLARGLAILFMIGVHVLWHWGSPAAVASPVGQAISFLGGPTGAPTFMFLMGASLPFSSRSTFSWLAARGAWLVFLGYLLNMLRGVIPAILGTAAGIVTPEQIAPFTPWYLLTTVDIHQMAGLSLIAIAVLRGWSRPGWLWLGLGGALVLASPWLRSVQFGTPLLDGPLTPVLGSAPNVYYAVVPWLFYPLAGAVFGSILARSADRPRVFRWAAVAGIGLGAMGAGLIVLEQPSLDVNTYWREPLPFVVGISGIVLAWLAACDAVARRPWLDRRLGLFYGWSARVIPMYFTHWLIVGWGIGVTGFRDLPLELVLPAILVAVFLTAKLSGLAFGLETTPAWLVRLFRSGDRLAPAAGT
jgi:uncharacterized membrane protein